MLITEPLTGSPALARSRQYAAAWRIGAKWPLRCTLMTASHSSSVMFVSIRSRRMPALFTSTCRSPNVSTAESTSALGGVEVGDVVVVGDGLSARRP